MNLKQRYRRLKWKAGIKVDAFVFRKIVRPLLRWLERDSNLVKHVEREWAAVWPNGDEMQDMMREHVLDMACVFTAEGHSGFSGRYAMHLIERALMFKPLGPLTGADSEWGEPFCSEGTRQNKRLSSVFKLPDGTVYDNEGENSPIYEDPDGARYTRGGPGNRTPVTFPYVQKPRPVVKVDYKGQPIEAVRA
jgi:hypothetical protein